MNFVKRVVVVRMIRPHRIDQANVVRHFRRVRQAICHPHSRLPMLRHRILTTHDDADFACARVSEFFVVQGKWLPVVAVQNRFWIEQIHLARTTVHKQLDHRFRLRWVMPVFRVEIKRRRRPGGFASEKVICKKVRQRRAENAVAGALKEVASFHGYFIVEELSDSERPAKAATETTILTG